MMITISYGQLLKLFFAFKKAGRRSLINLMMYSNIVFKFFLEKDI